MWKIVRYAGKKIGRTSTYKRKHNYNYWWSIYKEYIQTCRKIHSSPPTILISKEAQDRRASYWQIRGFRGYKLIDNKWKLINRI